MPHYRYKAEGRFPLYPSRQDRRFLPSNHSSPPAAQNHHPNPSIPHPIARVSATITNIIAYIPRRIYCRIKFHSRNGCDGIKGAHAVVSPSAASRAYTNVNVLEDEGRRSNDSESDTVVGSSIYSHTNTPQITPPASNANITIPQPTANEPHSTLTQSAHTFVNNATNDFRHRFADNFLSDTVHDLDDYVRMGQLESLEETLWERKEERRRRESEQWRSDTGFWGAGGL
jgi:hypothetical protein